jgi:hypothetical protein
MDARPRHEVAADLGSEGRESGSVARYFARERQKRELRGERDRVLLALARDLGQRPLAACMGVSEATVASLVADARERVGSGSSPAQSPIVARRLPDRRDWADADTHYEALGSEPHIEARRATPPPS